MTGGDVIRYVARDGRVIPTRVWSAPARASDGTLIGVIGAFREVPEAAAAAG